MIILPILASVAAVYLAASATRNRLRFIERTRSSFQNPAFEEGATWAIGIGGGILLLVAIWACVG